jgi:hypothetical protein
MHYPGGRTGRRTDNAIAVREHPRPLPRAIAQNARHNTHDYKRHGTTSLFAALDVKAGTIIGKCMSRHRAQGVTEGRDYTIEIDELKPDGHKGYEMVEEAIEALMRTLIIVRLPDGSRRRVQFLGGNDLDDPGRAGGCSPTALTSA